MKYLNSCFLCFVLLIIVLFQSGCTQLTVLRVAEIKEVSSKVDTLSLKLSTLQQKIFEELKKQNEMIKILRADQHIKFDEISTEIGALKGNISESQQKLIEIEKKTRELGNRWDKITSDDETNSTESVNNKVNNEIKQAFETAMADFTSGRYKDAALMYKTIIEKYPDSHEAEISLYWLAECYYAAKKFDKAESKYKEYIKMYPAGEKISAVYYKLGLIYGTEKKDKAKEFIWKKLIENYPDSQEAEIVRNRLKK